MSVFGFEPKLPAPKAGGLPSYLHTLKISVKRIELLSQGLQPHALAIMLHRDEIIVRTTGFEPATRGSSGPRYYQTELNPHGVILKKS